MKINNILLYFTFLLSFYPSPHGLHTQVNNNWEVATGLPSGIFDFTNSITDNQDNIYLTGNTTMSNDSVALLVQKKSFERPYY